MVSELERILRQGRKEKKLSQDEVAEKAGLDRSEIVKLESGLFVFLENDLLCEIAAAVGTDPEMFIAIYRSEFRSELRQMKLKQSENTNTENNSSKEDSIEHTGIDTISLYPDLIEIGREIMTMPDEHQKDLIHTIRMLVQSQIYAIRLKASSQSL